jgi:cobalt/nickel transport system permease protein
MSGHHALASAGVAGDRSSAVHALDPRAKIAGLLGVTLVAVSAPARDWPVFCACAAALAVVAVLARVPPGELWRRGLVVLPPILLVAAFVPFVRDGGTSYELGPLSVSEAGLETFAAVAAKALIGTAAAVLLAATTGFPDVLRGLESLRVPHLLTLIAALMYRYVFVLAEQLQRTRAALRARCHRPRSVAGVAALGTMTGAFFLRSYARGERVHRAMLARGYSGRMPRGAPLAFGIADLIFVAALAAVLLPLRIWLGVVA